MSLWLLWSAINGLALLVSAAGAEAKAGLPRVDLLPLLARPAPVTWVFAGDSITQGCVYTHGWRDYSQLFKERLYEMGRSGDVVINTAMSGMALDGLLPRLEERVLRFRPDVVFVMVGTNDAVVGPAGLAEFARRYEDLIRQCRTAGVKQVVLQTTIPMMPLDPEKAADLETYDRPEARDREIHKLQVRWENIPRYIEETREVALKMNVPLIDHARVWQAAGSRRGQLLEGEIHPNEYGHRLLAHTLFHDCAMWEQTSWTCRLFVPVNVKKKGQ